MDVIRAAAGFGLALVTAGCGMFVTREDGDNMLKEIASLRALTTRQSKELEESRDQAAKLRSLIDEATKVVTRNSADVGQNVQKLQVDLAALAGRVDDLQTQLNGLSKSFNDYRAASDTKLEQVVNATTAQQKPPIPETPDAIFAEAKKRLDAKQWVDARRLLEAFINRNANEARAPQAQYLIGESYFNEQRYANAIGAYTKVIDNYPKSEIVPDAMFKNGQAFYALKYCGDARIYFQELLRRYPKTEWKKDANEQLKKLLHDAKNKSICQS